MEQGDTDLGAAARKGIGWTVLESVILALFRFAPLAVLARYISPEDFGIFALSAFVVAFVHPLATLGFDLAIVQRKHLSADDLSTAWVCVLTMSSLLSALVALSSYSIASLVIKLPETGLALLALAPAVIINACGAMAMALRCRALEFRRISLANLTATVGTAVLVSVPLAVADFGYWALICGLLAEGLIRLLCLMKLPARGRRFHLSASSARSLWRYGRGATAGQVMNTLALEGDYLIIGRLLGASALGHYSRAYQLMAAPAILIGGAIQRVGTPTLAKLQGKQQQLADAYAATLELVAIFTLPISAVASVLASEAIRVMLGPGWHETALLFQILAAGVFFRTSYRLSASVLLANGKTFEYAFAQAGYAVLVILGAAVASLWSIAAVAVSTLGALGIFYGALTWQAQKCCGISTLASIRLHVRGFCLGAICGLVAWSSAAVLPHDLGPVPHLVIPSGMVCVVCAVMSLLAPQIVLGPRGARALQAVAKRLKNALRSRKRRTCDERES